MSEQKIRYFSEINKNDKQSHGVVSLAIRPNMPSNYGEGSLSGKQLQERFDRLAGLIIDRYNDMARGLSQPYVLEYFKLPEVDGEQMTLSNGQINLSEFIKHVADLDGDLFVESPYAETAGGKEKIKDVLIAINGFLDQILAFLALDEHERDATIKSVYATIQNLQLETNRAIETENGIKSDLSKEITRATTAEGNISANLAAEQKRATEAERNISQVLSTEANRAKAAETMLYRDLEAEVKRAKAAEKAISDGLSKEITRATIAESDLSNSLTNLSRIVEQLLQTDDETLTNLGEVIKYIANNEAIISSITDKIDKSSIVTSLDSDDASEVMSAATGKLIKEELDKKANASEITDVVRTADIADVVREDALTSSLEGYAKSTDLDQYVSDTELEGILGSLDNGISDNLHNILNYVFISGGSLGIEYDIYDAYAEVYGIGSSSTKNIIIASYVKGIPVTSIRTNAFAYKDIIRAITIPNSVTRIGGYAFYDCSNLTHIHYRGTVSQWNAIEKGSNWDDRTSSYTIHCTNGEITKDGTVTYYPSEGLEFALDNGSYSVTGIGTCTDTDIIIPHNHEGLPVVGIVDYAFQNLTQITNVVIPDSVTSIGEYAFMGCSNLTSIDIPDSITSVGYGLLAFCSSLTSVTIPNNWAYIPSDTFAGCTSLESITIPNSVTSIGQSAFEGCTSLTSIIIPDSVTNIEDNAFRSCSGLTSITIGNGITSIGSHAFIGCSSLASIEVDGNNQYYKSIDGNLYTKDGSVLIKYAIGKTDSIFAVPNGVTAISEDAVKNGRSLNTIVISDGVTSIGDSAFYGCSSLGAAWIPKSVTYIGRYVFGACILANVYYLGTKEEWEKIDIAKYNDVLLNATIHFSSGG